MGTAVEADLVVGVDTHLDTHTAALCDARGRTVSQLQVAATSAGYAKLLEWADSAAAGRPVTWAIEGTRHYGLALASVLVTAPAALRDQMRAIPAERRYKTCAQLNLPARR